MSTVKLTTFSIFRTHGAPGASGSTVETLYGASAARFNDTNGVELLADSVPFHADAFVDRAPRPGCGLLMLYGIRDTLEEMHYWRTKARELGASFTYAEIEFAVGDIEVGLTDRKKLKDAAGKGRFLNLRRMTASLQSQVLQRFSQYAAAEGRDISEEMSRVSQIATRPDYFDNLFDDDADMGKLDILVVPVADDPAVPGRMRQVAYVRPGAEVVSTVQGSDEATILLPAWMTNKALAKKMRRQAESA